MSDPVGGARAAAEGVHARLANDVEALTAIARGSADEGELAAARWASRRLADAAGVAVRVERFRYRRTFAHVHALHFAAGAIAARARGSQRPLVRGLARAAAAATFAAFELDYSGRLQPLAGLPPVGTGANVVCELPSPSAGDVGTGAAPSRAAALASRERRVVLVAHLDAARAGIIWHPAIVRPGDRLARRSGRRASLALVPELALAAVALAPAAIARAAGRLLAAAALLTAESLARAPVPGANDNASGVAAVLELARRLAARPPANAAVEVVLTGAEEAGMGGMAAYLASAGARRDRANTLFLGLDTVGSGEPVVLVAEGGAWPVRYRERDVELARAAARRAGLPVPRRWRIGGWTDPALARLRGFPALSLLSVRDGGFPNYHRPGDVPAHVDIDCVAAVVDIAEAIVRAWASER